MNVGVQHEQVARLNVIWKQIMLIVQEMGNQMWRERLEGAASVEIGILNIIHTKPNVIMRDIKDILDVPASTLTNAVDRLEQKGLIKRVISQLDRRSFELKLTKDGRIAQAEHLQKEIMICQQALSALDGEEERQAFITSLQKIVNSFAGVHYHKK